MATAARLPLAAWRNELCVRTINIVGLDLTAAATANTIRAQIRSYANQPGDPKIDLATVTTASAEGIKLDSVTTDGEGIPTSTLILRINKSTMSDPAALPYSGEAGDDNRLRWQLQIDGTTRAYGDFIALASAIDSDIAPTEYVSGTTLTSSTRAWDTATLTFSDDAVSIVIDGAGVVSALTVRSESAGARAELAEAAAIAAANGPYPDTASGIAATSDGDYFTVVGDGTNTFSKLYKNNAGTAVDQSVSVPSAGYVQSGFAARKANLALTGYGDPIFGNAVIRQDTAGSGWYAIGAVGHTDPGHAPANITGLINTSGGNIVVNYGYTVAKVGQASVTPDETFAQLGIVPGASVATDKMTISLYMPLHGYFNMPSISTTAGTGGVSVGTYFTGDVTAQKDAANARVTITHPTCGSNSSVPALAPYFVETDIVAWRNVLTAFTATSVTSVTVVPFIFTVSYDGTNWNVTTPMAIAPTVTGAMSGGGALTIAFNQTIPASVTLPRVDQPPYHATVKGVRRFGGTSTTQIVLVWVDSAGAIITTPSTGMQATISLPIEVKAATPAGRFGIVRPNAKADAGKVASGSGDFWIGMNHQLT